MIWYVCVVVLIMSNLVNIVKGSILNFTPAVILISIVIYNLLINKCVFPYKKNIVFIFLILIICVGSLRSGDPNLQMTSQIFRVIKLIFFTSLFVQVFKRELLKGRNLEYLYIYMVYLPIFITICIDLVMYYFGVGIITDNFVGGGSGFGKMILLSNLGVSVNDNLLFITNLNGDRHVIALLMLLSMIGWSFLTKYKLLMKVGTFFSMIILLLLDTRSGFLYPLIIWVVIKQLFVKRNQIKLIFTLPFILIFGSVLMLFLLSFVSQIDGVERFTRSQEDLETASMRSIIWAVSNLEFLNFKFIHLFGYGDFGHYTSGASKLWESVFQGWTNSDQKTPHSLLYVTLFDYGYLGLTVLVIAILNLLKKIKTGWGDYKFSSIITSAFIMFWILIGVTESLVGFYAKNILYIVISFFMFMHFSEHVIIKNKKLNG